MSREVGAVLEVELVLTGLLDRHRQLQPVLTSLLRNIGAELLIDQDARRGRLGPARDRLEHPLEDQSLGVGDRCGLLGGGITLDPEHLLLERSAVVEREDVQLPVVAKGHGTVLRQFEVYDGVYGRVRRAASGLTTRTHGPNP